MERAHRREDGVWELALDTGETRAYDALLVANGHHWSQRWPEPAFPGSDAFAGEQLHAHSYVDNSLFADRDVVVLGMGNSAMDIAVESSYVARNTYLAARQGAWIIPKYVFGRPVDTLPNNPRIPFRIRQRMIHQTIKSFTGDPERYGLPRPNHKFGEAHPTVSGRILDRIAHGTIAPKPNIASLAGEEVRFTDGSSVHADVVVYCTGYKITFPFFDEDLISAPDNHIELFWRVFHPEIDNVFFIGLLQPLGAIMPLAEAQSTWVGDHLLGEYALPDACAAARGHTGRPGGHAQALRGLQAAHHPGGLRRLPLHPGEGAPRGRRARTRTRAAAPTARTRGGHSSRGVSRMPRFCRHSRFIERCPICRETVPGLEPVKRSPSAARSRRAAAGSGAAGTRARGRSGSGKGVRVYTDGSQRGQDDGYSCGLVPGLHNSGDAQRLAEELAFASGRLNLLSASPPDLYGEVRQQESWERATWMCFLIAYLSPLQGEEPFNGIRRALDAEVEVGDADWRVGELPDLDAIPLGPRTSHEYARGTRTLQAYLQWAERAGSQVRAFSGDHSWSESRRFERLFERLALPGLGRMGRYDLLVTLGRLGLYELRAELPAPRGRADGGHRRSHDARRQAAVRHRRSAGPRAPRARAGRGRLRAGGGARPGAGELGSPPPRPSNRPPSRPPNRPPSRPPIPPLTR